MHRRRLNTHHNKVIKVVFTGGPCAGKTTSMEKIQELISEKYGKQWNCFTVAEAASVLYSVGKITRTELEKSRERLKAWQRDVVECSMAFEHVYDKIAAKEEKKDTLILCDRGALDPKVFTPEDMWPEILSDMEVTEGDLMQRYDIVFLLHTAPSTNYTQRNNTARRESHIQASLLDGKYAAVWRNHPKLIDINSNKVDGFDEKFATLWRHIEELL